MSDFICYTDGACAPNPGEMGIGYYIIDQLTDKEYQGYEYLGHGTNNIAELTSVYRVLQVLPKDSDVLIYTDSSYSIGVLSKNWKAKANISLIDAMKAELSQFKNVVFQHVKGHNGDPGNELVNTLAQTATKTKLSKPIESMNEKEKEKES